ncbi:MAG: Eco57I restriction-modification methylase domain-containing protein [Candidatus Heimdallarchaeota archaeon]
MKDAKGMGQYFTPRFVAEFMVSLIQKDKSVPVLEPAAGKGVFLDVLWKKGFRNILAYEIDANLPNESPAAINYQDFLTVENLASPEVIIGNPPYVRWKNMAQKDRERFKKDPKWKKIVNGLSDLSYAFMHKCVDILQPEGELIFITPYFWTETLHSSDLRRKIASCGDLATVINFHEMRIFPTVSLSTVVFKFVKERSNRQIKVLHVWSKTNLTHSVLSKIKTVLSDLESGESYISKGEIEAYLHPQFKGGLPWKFLSPPINRRLKTIEEACTHSAPHVAIDTGQQVLLSKLYEEDDIERFNISKEILKRSKFRGRTYWRPKGSSKPLNDFFPKQSKEGKKYNSELPGRYVRLGDVAEIGNGMVSGLDKAFRLPEEILLSTKEKARIIYVVKAKSLHQFYHEGVARYAFLNGISSETEFKKSYPNIFVHIKQFKEKLLKRYSYNRHIPWWEWVFLRNRTLFEQNAKKIFVPCKDRFDKRGYVRFALVEGQFFATQDVTAIVKSDQFQEDEKYLVAILNSEITFEWLRHKGLTRGGVLEFSEKPLTRIPIRLINWSDEEEVLLHNAIVELTEQIIETHQLNPIKGQIEEKIQDLYERTGSNLPY